MVVPCLKQPKLKPVTKSHTKNIIGHGVDSSSSYYNQTALLGIEGESDRPGDSSEESAVLNAASGSYSKLQQHLDGR